MLVIEVKNSYVVCLMYTYSITALNYFILLSDGSYGDPETILDENELLERYSHVDITKIKMSPSGKVGIFL